MPHSDLTAGLTQPVSHPQQRLSQLLSLPGKLLGRDLCRQDPLLLLGLQKQLDAYSTHIGVSARTGNICGDLYALHGECKRVPSIKPQVETLLRQDVATVKFPQPRLHDHPKCTEDIEVTLCIQASLHS